MRLSLFWGCCRSWRSLRKQREDDAMSSWSRECVSYGSVGSDVGGGVMQTKRWARALATVGKWGGGCCRVCASRMVAPGDR